MYWKMYWKHIKWLIFLHFILESWMNFFYQIRNGSKTNLSDILNVHCKHWTLLQIIKYTWSLKCSCSITILQLTKSIIKSNRNADVKKNHAIILSFINLFHSLAFDRNYDFFKFRTLFYIIKPNPNSNLAACFYLTN